MARRRKSDACPDPEPTAPLEAEQVAQEPDGKPVTVSPLTALTPALAGLHGRRDARLAPPRRTLPRLHRREGLVVHCTDGRRPLRPEDVPAILRSGQAYRKRVLGRPDAGYQWAVDPWGHVWQRRGWGVIGAHAKTAGHNLMSHGVVVLGDGSDLTDPEAAAILWIVEDARRR